MKDRYEGMSMGCQVESLECPVCGLGGPHVHKHDRVFRDGVEYPVGSWSDRFLPSSVVEAPRCVECRTEMQYLDGTDWACMNSACELNELPVTTGVGGMFLFGMVPGPRGT